jgi:putative endonuclease
MSEEYYVYILECADHTLYTGIAKNVDKRMKEHESGKGAKYTRGRGPFSLRYVERITGKSQALQRELEIKALTRLQKWQLIREAGNENVSTKEL